MCSKKCAFPKATYTGELEEDLILVFFIHLHKLTITFIS